MSKNYITLHTIQVRHNDEFVQVSPGVVVNTLSESEADDLLALGAIRPATQEEMHLAKDRSQLAGTAEEHATVMQDVVAKQTADAAKKP